MQVERGLVVLFSVCTQHSSVVRNRQPSLCSGRHSLLVTGLGPVGLAAALVGRALGVRRIYGTDTNAYRLQFAKDKVRGRYFFFSIRLHVEHDRLITMVSSYQSQSMLV